MRIYKLFLYSLLLLFVMIGCSNNQEDAGKHPESITFDNVADLETTTIGNNSDVINAVSALPAGTIPHTVEISSKNLLIDYDLEKFNEDHKDEAAYWYDTKHQEKASRLNSAILFSLIPNLDKVEMTFKGETDESYTVTRAELSDTLDMNLDTWDKETFEKMKKGIAD
ncbi:DUF4825 domain-containing protein [Rossellomorea sp. SC111]|uniref:DUF4825 domain-containing protein n=1 Tax=Rossellomorea sp. SC111 TaxID=2968985 RepID=UPI00215ABE37|nr:DUF4825 domain-containing protein [Rossellomorea sp. SC111]MCR8848284.1 DUF4825 domain-containing protein [Rossellomorea sp. SC111]